jgi:hypothetical protein
MLPPNFATIITMPLTSLVNGTAFLSVENNIVFIIGFCLTGGYHCLQGTCCLQLSLNVEQCTPLRHCNHKTIWCHNPQCDLSAMKTANHILDYSTCFFLSCDRQECTLIALSLFTCMVEVS